MLSFNLWQESYPVSAIANPSLGSAIASFQSLAGILSSFRQGSCTYWLGYTRFQSLAGILSSFRFAIGLDCGTLRTFNLWQESYPVSAFFKHPGMTPSNFQSLAGILSSFRFSSSIFSTP